MKNEVQHSAWNLRIYLHLSSSNEERRQYILEDSYVCLDGRYTFLTSTMYHLSEPEDLSGCGDQMFLPIQKSHHCTIANAFIPFNPNSSNSTIHLYKLIKTFGMYCKPSIGYHTTQASFAAIKNFGSDLIDIEGHNCKIS